MARKRRLSYIEQYALARTFGPVIAFLIVLTAPGLLFMFLMKGIFGVEVSAGAAWFVIILFWVSIFIYYIRSKINESKIYNPNPHTNEINPVISSSKPSPTFSMISSPISVSSSSSYVKKSSAKKYNSSLTAPRLSNVCPLKDKTIESIISNLKKKSQEYDFDTYDFVEHCLVKEKFCPIRIKTGNRKVCGSRLGEYRTTTGKIIDPNSTSGSRGRKWIKNSSDSNKNKQKEGQKPDSINLQPQIRRDENSSSMQSPITRGHIATVEWIKTDSFRKIKEAYDKVFGKNQVYFRITDRGVTAISLDSDCPSFLGISSSRDTYECYIDNNSQVKSIDYYKNLKKQFDIHKHSIRRKSIEECSVLYYINEAFKSRMKMPCLPSNYKFINNEWRFLDFDGKGKKSDILAVNTITNSLVIVEFKDKANKEARAVEQLHDYAKYFAKYREDYNKYFEMQIQAMGTLYDIEELKKIKINNTNPELYFVYPIGSKYNLKRIY